MVTSTATVGKNPGLAILQACAVFCVFLAEVILLQWLGGAYENGFGAISDEAAHFVSALMVSDFIAGQDYLHPIAFAQAYYVHYPKVAIGNWPPMLYAALGLWLLIFGASRAAALAFIAIAAAATSCVTYYAGKKLLNAWAGWFAGILFLALPLVQESSARVMTEHLVTLLMLVSALQFAKYMRTQQISDGLMFGGIAAIAILTRGSAWALGLLPGITILLTRRFALLGHSGLWLSAVPIFIFCVPWYVLSRGMSEGAWVGDSGGTSFFAQALKAFPSMIAARLGIALLLPAALGVWSQIIAPWRKKQVSPEWAALFGLAVGTLALHCLIPASIEGRYMVTVMPPLLLFAAAGVGWLCRWIPDTSSRATASAALFLAVMLAFVLETFTLATSQNNRGYEALAQDLLRRSSHKPQVYLIASDSPGEGSMIAAMASREEPRPQSIVLRGSKILVREDWLGRGTEDRFGSVEETEQLFSRIPVNVVIVDDSTLPDQRHAYHDRVKAAVVSNQATWEHVGSYPVVRQNRLRENALHVYARRETGLGDAAQPTVDIKLIESLMDRRRAK